MRYSTTDPIVDPKGIENAMSDSDNKINARFSELENKIDAGFATLKQLVGAIRDEAEAERSSAKMRRWFLFTMLCSGVLQAAFLMSLRRH
jgi:hypothetical protein